MSKVRLRSWVGSGFIKTADIALESRVATVCEEALCPNIGECWGSGTATFMVLGSICTRGCRFCYVSKGRPPPPDPLEPIRVAEAVKEMGLDYVTITSVDRDDLPDGGASHIAKTIVEVKRLNPHVLVEVLIPDFQGDLDALETVLDAGPDVLAHNIETVERLTPLVRDRRAGYWQSISILEAAKRRGFVTKSSILLGFGESIEEVRKSIVDLANINLDILVFSQYLRPSEKQLPVKKYYAVEEFKYLERIAYELGIRSVVAHPLARTSYKAKEAYIRALRNM